MFNKRVVDIYTPRVYSWRMDALNEAIKSLGSQAALAKAMGVTPMAVSQWKSRGVPAERVLALEAATGGRVLRHEIRPDIYPPPDHQHPQAATA